MIRKFAHYYKPYILPFTLDLLAAFTVALCNLLFPLFTRKMLNEFIPEHRTTILLTFAGGLLLFYLIKVGLNYYMAYRGHIMAANMQADMRRDLFHKFEKLPCTYFDNHKTGELMSRLSGDLFDVSELAHHGPEDLFISIAQFTGAFIILLTISVPLAFICFAILPPLIFVVAILRKKMGKAARKSRAEIAELNAGLENSLSGIRLTRAFNALETEETRFAVRNGAYVEARRDFCRSMGYFHGVMNFATDFLSLLILTLGGILILETDSLDYVDLVTFMLYISVFIQPIQRMVGFMEQFENGMSGFVRFVEIMEEEEETDDPGALPAPALTGNIEFDHVRFSYIGHPEIFHDLSFSVKAGTTLALVGSSGGGKTTICHLLPRFYEIADGAIRIDGTDIRSMTRTSLRSQIGIVAQDVFLFNASIYDNIAYGSDGVAPEEVREAARKARLDAFIDSLPDGYDTAVGERGVKLSGGQKQRIAIARVFLKNPPILILDEATSALDNITEHEIQKSLSELSEGRTTVVVAHRLSTVRNADEIMYVEHGEIAERGTHESLLALDGEYAALVRATEGV